MRLSLNNKLYIFLGRETFFGLFCTNRGIISLCMYENIPISSSLIYDRCRRLTVLTSVLHVRKSKTLISWFKEARTRSPFSQSSSCELSVKSVLPSADESRTNRYRTARPPGRRQHASCLVTYCVTVFFSSSLSRLTLCSSLSFLFYTSHCLGWECTERPREHSVSWARCYS